MLNLEWFRTFKVIYEVRSLSAAAQALFISQPGVSLHLSSLESYTGHRLFERNSRKMAATERGTILYDFIIDHIGKLEEAEQLFHHTSTIGKPSLSVGMCLEVFQYTLESHVWELSFNLTTKFGESAQMLQELNNGTLDLILTTQKCYQHNLEFTPFSLERLVLVCGNQTNTKEFHQLLQDDNRLAMNTWLAGQTWYTKAVDMEPLKRFWEVNFGCLPGLRPNYVVPCYNSILRCLYNGEGFALVPDFICKKSIEDQLIKLVWEGSPPVENILYFGKRKKSASLNEIKQLENILSSHWPALSDQVFHQYAI